LAAIFSTLDGGRLFLLAWLWRNRNTKRAPRQEVNRAPPLKVEAEDSSIKLIEGLN
jgi:hypothetical protein